MRPGVTVDTPPFRMVKSVPQSVVLLILTMTSEGILDGRKGLFFPTDSIRAVVHQSFHDGDSLWANSSSVNLGFRINRIPLILTYDHVQNHGVYTLTD